MITEKVSEILGLPIVNEYATEGPWKMFDDGSAEISVLEFFYALVRLVKPKEVLETGTYLGLSGSYLGMGLKENGFGHLDSIEWNEDRMEEAKSKWTKLELDDFITPHRMSSLEFDTKKQYELVLLDTEPQTRFQELKKFWNNIAPGGIIAIHDLHSDMGTTSGVWHDIDLVEPMIKSHELTVINFYTPRGFTLCRKANPGPTRPDYIHSILK